MSLQEVCLKSSNKSANIEYFWFLWALAELSRMIKTSNSRKKYSSAKVSVDLEKRSICCFWRSVAVMSVDGLLFFGIHSWKKKKEVAFKCVKFVSSTFDITHEEDLQERKNPMFS